MKHLIAHDLDLGLAKEVAVRAFESYQKRFADYNPKMSWVKERDAKIEFNVKVVDKVLISKYGGTEIKIDGENFLIMREDDILGIIG